MQRLTWYGLALHGGHPHGYPASHGCIRLPMGFAAALFREDTKGMSVVITGHAPSRRQTLIASQRKSRLSAPADDAQASDFPSGEGASDTVREPCCAPADVQASPPPVPASEGDDNTDDQPAYGPQSGDAYYNPDQVPDDERYNGYHSRAHQRERSREVPPPQDLPPPPN